MKITDWVISGIKIANFGRYALEVEADKSLPWTINYTYKYEWMDDVSLKESVIVDVFLDIGKTSYRLQAVTQFTLDVSDKSHTIVGEENFNFFTKITQMAISHARIMFIQAFAAYEAAEFFVPYFEDDLLYERVKTSVQQQMN